MPSDVTPIVSEPESSVEKTLTLLTGLAQQMSARQVEMESKLTKLGRPNIDETVDAYQAKLNPWSKVWKGLAVVAAIVATIFGAGVGYQKVIGDNATKTDIETHVTEDLMPVKADVKQIQEDLAPVKTGVQSLVKTQDSEREVKRLKRKLKRHDKEHLHSLEEYAADKAAGRRATRPMKTPSHIDLEDKVEELEDKL